MSQLVSIKVRPETLRDLQTLAEQRGVDLADLVDDLVVDAKPDSHDEHAWEEYRRMMALTQSRSLLD